MSIIFDNLISNAIKYSFNNTSISINIKFLKEKIMISFTNIGYGISKKEEGRIFSKMYRASNIQTPEGFGLGLYLVKKLIIQLRGSIYFKSSEGDLTTFFIELPYNK